KEISSYVKVHGCRRTSHTSTSCSPPPGVESCFELAGFECSAGSESPLYCAYHGFIKATGGPIIYANDPIDGGLSHEHNESITDPGSTRGTTRKASRRPT